MSLDQYLTPSLAKRLLSASRLGILFNFAHGHRWLTFVDDGTELTGGFKEILEQNDITITDKIYGDIFEALEFIDYVLVKCKQSTLEQQFDKFQDWMDPAHGIPCSSGPDVFDEHYIDYHKPSTPCDHDWFESEIFDTCPRTIEYTCKTCGEKTEVEGEGTPK